MKSCLKSPPLTPNCSLDCSPSGSGSASPGSSNIRLPCLRKQVSFCEKEGGLEEFFQADDWDRTPAPVAPKLCYQEILELKQIMQSLPRAPFYPSYRQPYTTSVPRSNSPPLASPGQPFPISRLASSPSLTPSRWKNRDDSANIDPEILPYLESVPIRLLPLLPPSLDSSKSSAPPPPSSSKVAESNATASNTVASNPTETTRSPCPASAPLLPAITLQSPSNSTTTTLSSLIQASSPSPPSPQQQTPTRPRANFIFMPLLPIEEKKVSPQPVVETKQEVKVKKFNMTFLPLLPPEEPQQVAFTTLPAVNLPESTPQQETPPEEQHSEDGGSEEVELVNSPPTPYMPIGYHRYSPTSTPSLSSASDTDTESEAPSVSSPGPSSPIDDYETLTHYFASHATRASQAFDSESPNLALNAVSNIDSTHNPYFPAVSAHAPLPAAVAADPNNALLQQLFSSQVPLSEIPAMVKKLKLEALPSPTLAPPSPFSLYPPESEEDKVEVEVQDAKPTEIGDAEATLRVSGPSGTITKRAFVARPSGLSCWMSNIADSKTSAVSAPRPAMSSTSESPELTVEALRAAYKKASKRSIVDEEGMGLLGPSISRREH